VSGVTTLEGKVGIGTAPAAASLTVNGATALDGGLTVSGATILEGKVGIGTAPGMYSLAIGSKFWGVNYATSIKNQEQLGYAVDPKTKEPWATLSLVTNNSRRITIDDVGNIGINDTNPAALLHVFGYLKVDRSVTLSDSLTVNGVTTLNGTVTLGTDAVITVARDWIDVTIFQNSWTNYDTKGAWAKVGYYKDSNGTVWLRGMATGGKIVQNSDTEMFTLPPGYRPVARQLYSVASARKENNLALGRVDVDSDGRVLVVDGENQWLSLDGIAFQAAN
jgi:hypothetical protein